MNNNPPLFIDTPAKMQEVLPALKASEMLGVDTELDTNFTYEGRICLVQISTPDMDCIFDPLALDMAPLAPLFSDPERTAIFHAGSNDIPHLKHQFDFTFARIFDTYLAAGALNYQKRGLAALLEQHFGVVLDKKYQRADWRLRPLSPEMLQYARYDTAYLFDLRQVLLEELIQAKRLRAAEHAFKQATLTTYHPKVINPDGWAKIKGLDTVPPRNYGIVRELYLWREHEAQRRNMQPVRVMLNHILVRLAQNPPSSEREAREMAVSPYLERFPNQITAVYNAIVSGKKIGAISLPHARNSKRIWLEPATQKRLHALKEWRAYTLSHDNVSPEFLLSNSDIFALAQRDFSNIDELRQSNLLPDYVVDQYGSAIIEKMRQVD